MSHNIFTGYGGSFTQYQEEPLPDIADGEVFDDETMAALTDYLGHEPWVSQNVTEEVFSMSDTDKEMWTLSDFEQMLERAKAEVPAHLQDTATITLSVFGEYASAVLGFSYVRPETKEEVKLRVARALRYVRDKQKRDRLAYEELKQKFERKAVK